MKLPYFPPWGNTLMALAALTLFASPAASMPLIDAHTTNADAFDASTEEAPKAMLLTLSAPQHGIQMDGQVVVTMKKPTDVTEGESIQGFLMTDGHEMTGIIINKINGLFVLTDRATGLILWRGQPNKLIIGL